MSAVFVGLALTGVSFFLFAMASALNRIADALEHIAEEFDDDGGEEDEVEPLTVEVKPDPTVTVVNVAVRAKEWN